MKTGNSVRRTFRNDIFWVGPNIYCNSLSLIWKPSSENCAAQEDISFPHSRIHIRTRFHDKSQSHFYFPPTRKCTNEKLAPSVFPVYMSNNNDSHFSSNPLQLSKIWHSLHLVSYSIHPVNLISPRKTIEEEKTCLESGNRMPTLHTCPEIDATPPITSFRQTKTRSRSRASPRKSNKSHMTLVSRSAESEGQSQNACTAIEAKPHT